MTDRLECPNCDGTGNVAFGPLTVLCTFCRGQGYVGGDNEPADRDEPVEEFNPYEAPQPLAGDEPGAGIPGCPACLGVGTVVNVGDVRRPTTLVEAPCPMCR